MAGDGTAMVTVLQGFRRTVGRWGGRRGSRRSLWASRGSEGGPVAVVMASGGDGLRSVRRTEEGGSLPRREDAGEKEKEKVAGDGKFGQPGGVFE